MEYSSVGRLDLVDRYIRSQFLQENPLPLEKGQVRLEAVAMDMWQPYIASVEEAAEHVKIVFDLFHVVAAFNKVIDKVRISEKKRASKEYKGVFLGAKYLLLKRRIRKREHRAHLKQLLRLNETLFQVVLLRDKLPRISRCRRHWLAANERREPPPRLVKSASAR